MKLLLTISQLAQSDAVTSALITTAVAVLGLRGSCSHATVGTFRREGRGEDRLVSFVLLTTFESPDLVVGGVRRALEIALAATRINDVQVEVLEELSQGTSA